MRIDCRMDIGIGKRCIEDRVLVNNSILAGGVYSVDIPHNESIVIAVADGVGGNNAGDLAAHIAVEGLLSLNLSSIDSEMSLKTRIKQINAKIIEHSHFDLRYDKMATTLSGLYYTGSRWFLFHVGNTRVYLFESPYLKQMTSDHTLASEMIQAGMSTDEIQDSGSTSTITSCLGNGDTCAADKLEVFDVTPSVLGADKVFFTSDGIHDFIPHAMLERGIASGAPTLDVLRLSMELARTRGSLDDLSMICLNLKEN